jgi:hypothetical protein
MGYWNLMRVNPQTAQGAVVMSNTTRHWDITGFADDAIEAASSSPLGDAVTVRGGSRELPHRQMDQRPSLLAVQNRTLRADSRARALDQARVPNRR